MEREEFLSSSYEKISDLLHKRTNSPVCIFPFNGTRRWFLLEHGHNLSDVNDPADAYSDITGYRYLEMYQMIFQHGLDTLIAPTFGGEILNRGSEYMEKIGVGLARLATHPDFVAFYHQNQVRVRFYGDYRSKLNDTPYSYIIDLFDKITSDTEKYTQYRLFYGVYADDPVEHIAKLTIDHYQKVGRTPKKRELIELYYGEYVEKADIFIGFEKFNVYDYPLLSWGEESLYFTVAPSLYMTDHQLRSLLYDYIYLRPVQDPDYSTMPVDDLEAMRRFYQVNRTAVFGVGEMRGGIWYPKSGVQE